MKMKTFYLVSFWFGVFYLISKILLIPGLIALYQAQGVSLSQFVHFVSTSSLISNIAYFGSLINGVIAGILISTISFSLIRNKISANKTINVGTVMVSFDAFIVATLLIVSVFLAISTHSVQALLNMSAQISKMTYPIGAIFFFVSIALIVIGYIQEQLKTSPEPKKYFRIILPSLAVLIIAVIDVLKVVY